MSRKELIQRIEELKQKGYVERISEKEFQAVCNKYSSYNEFMKQYMSYGALIKDDVICYTGNALKIREDIFQYKNQVAKKHGRALKENVYDKAFIDLSDCVLRMYDMNLEDSIDPDCFYNHSDKDNICVTVPYKGNICLPFKSCYIYTELPMVAGNVIELNTNPMGYYEGTFYICMSEKRYAQAKIFINRDLDKNFKNGDVWYIHVLFPKKQRPLGCIFNNINALLVGFRNGKKEFLDFCVQSGKGNPLATLAAKNVDTIIGALSYMSSYKSKVLYEIKNDTSMYVYADKSDENFTDYMQENYTDMEYKRVDGWIVNGYWKFLPHNQWGKSFDGKNIQGMDWVVPYKDDFKEEQKQKAVSNTQTSMIVPIHAIERAKQRYNVDLSSDDLKVIADEVLAGHDTKKLSVRDKLGRLYTSKNELGCYRLKYKNKYMDVVLSRCLDKNSYRVATFLPAPKDLNSAIIDSKDYQSVMADCEI